MINGTTLQYIPAFMINKGFAASVFLATNAGTALILRIFAYRLMDHLNRPKAIGLILAGMGMALFLLRWADSHTAFIFGGLLYGTFMGIGFPIILALAPDIFPPHLIPKGVSIGMLAMDAGLILAPVLAGYLGQSFRSWGRLYHHRRRGHVERFRGLSGQPADHPQTTPSPVR